MGINNVKSKVLASVMLVMMSFPTNVFAGYNEPIEIISKTIFTSQFKFGDIDGNDKVNATDLLILNKYILGIISEFPSTNGVLAADVNSDKKVNSADSLIIKKSVLGFITDYPVGSDSGSYNSPLIELSKEEETLYNLVNKARQDNGISPLKVDAQLMKLAKMRAQDMVDNNYFSSQSPNYGSPTTMVNRYGINCRVVAQNLAGSRTVERAFDGWMNSDGNKRNILSSSYSSVGYGIVDSKDYGKIIVQLLIG